MKCPEPHSMTEIAELATAINRLAKVIEKHGLRELGGKSESLYKAAPEAEPEMTDEVTMAAQLSIPARTLGSYRRKGKFPGCWIRNGKRIRWRVDQTVASWKRGIS